MKVCLTVAMALALVFLFGCGGNAGSAGSPPPPPNPDFTLSTSSTTLQIPRGSSGTVQVTVKPAGGFSGSVTVTPSGLPSSVTSAAVTIAAGSSGTLTFNVSTATGSGPFTVSLTGTSGSLSHATSLTLAVPYGGAQNTIVPRTSGTGAVSSTVAAYLTKLVADFQPVQLTQCGSATSPHTIEIVYDPTQGWHFDENNLIIVMPVLPSPNATGVDQNFDPSVIHESTHALQTDIPASSMA